MNYSDSPDLMIKLCAKSAYASTMIFIKFLDTITSAPEPTTAKILKWMSWSFSLHLRLQLFTSPPEIQKDQLIRQTDQFHLVLLSCFDNSSYTEPLPISPLTSATPAIDHAYAQIYAIANEKYFCLGIDDSVQIALKFVYQWLTYKFNESLEVQSNMTGLELEEVCDHITKTLCTALDQVLLGIDFEGGIVNLNFFGGNQFRVFYLDQ